MNNMTEETMIINRCMTEEIEINRMVGILMATQSEQLSKSSLLSRCRANYMSKTTRSSSSRICSSLSRRHSRLR